MERLREAERVLTRPNLEALLLANERRERRDVAVDSSERPRNVFERVERERSEGHTNVRVFAGRVTCEQAIRLGIGGNAGRFTLGTTWRRLMARRAENEDEAPERREMAGERCASVRAVCTD